MDITQILLQAGPLGAIVVWFALRVEKNQVEIAAAIDRSNRIGVLMLVSTPTTSEPVKTQAGVILTEIDAADEKRKIAATKRGSLI